MGQRLASCVCALAAVALLALTSCGGSATTHPPSEEANHVDLHGVVKLGKGTPIADAAVLVGGTLVHTDSQGEFTIPQLIPGLYNATVETGLSDGFQYRSIHVFPGMQEEVFSIP